MTSSPSSLSQAPAGFSGAGVSVAIVGTGSYAPEKVLTNADLEKMVDTTDEWIVTRSGIRERHIAREDEATSDLATVAAQRALEQAKVAPEDVDLIIVATITPDMVFPSTACFVQNRLGARNATCFDLEAACSGFLFAVNTASQYIKTGAIRTALVIGAEKLSTVIDWQDRATCVLFGDGAGAVVLQACAPTEGILSTVTGSDGALTELLNLPGGGSRHPTSPQTIEQRLHYMKMVGKDVFKHAVRAMSEAGRKAIEQAGLTIDQIACVVPHQANMRIVEAIRDRMGVGPEKFFVNLDRYGNMSAASIPVALDEAVRMGRIQRGDAVLLVAFGGGFTWAAMVIRW
ncbi:MAG: beta-ketoacyl-ACP synthase III [bacterium]